MADLRETALFDMITRDPHPNALAGLTVILDVAGAPAPQPGGTPTPGTIVKGTVIMMDNNGEAILGDGNLHTQAAPKLYVFAVDGDTDLDGAFMHRITCVEGGMQIKTDQFDGGGGPYTPGVPLSVGTGATAGLLVVCGNTDDPLLGYVGPGGILDDGSLDVLIPQGRCR